MAVLLPPSLVHLAHLAAYNRWMNGKLYAAAATLSPEALHGDMKAFFGSIHGTLNHLAVADTLWLKRLARHPGRFQSLAFLNDISAPTALDQTLFPDFSALAAHRARLDEALVDFCAEVSEAQLGEPFEYTSTKGVKSTKLLFGVLLHLFNHQAHHRGQATTLFHQLGVDVGPTDFILLLPEVA
ncbi:MAG: DUF664 domain-containing protein [Rubrivivax sp.]|nr:MAG: DUF664 domain-containing protein [Rubrivivax sp.]